MRKITLHGYADYGILKRNSNRLKYVDLMYLFGILMVVWGHSHPLDGSWWGTWYEHMNVFIYSFHMPLFFFLGGYLMVHSSSIDRTGYKNWVVSKLLKFLIPYIVLTAIAYFPKATLSSISDNVEVNLQYFLQTTFLEPRNGIWGHFWFIPTFLILDLIWGAWRYWSKRSKIVFHAGLIIGIISSLLMKLFPINTNLFGLNDFMQETIYYVCGIVIAIGKPVLWNKTWKNVVGIAVSIPVVYILYPIGNQAVNKYPFISFLTGILLIWICWSISLLLEKFHFKFPEKLTRYAFSIYLYSWPVQAVMDVILRRLGTNWMISIVIMFMTGIAVPFIIIFVYKKLRFLHCKFFDYLIGISTVHEKGAAS